MEGILKRRYPNSIPALILAASAAGDSVDKNTVEFMERRIKKLEADLEGKDEEAKKSLRTMEQQFQKMKVCAREQAGAWSGEVPALPAQSTWSIHAHQGGRFQIKEASSIVSSELLQQLLLLHTE